MDRQKLVFIAVAISMLYGIGFLFLGDTSGYAVVGAMIVALA